MRRQRTLKRMGTATLVLHRRVVVRVDAFVELKIMRVPNPVDGCDHRHIGASETPYVFTTVEQLIADFMADVRRLLDERT